MVRRIAPNAGQRWINCSAKRRDRSNERLQRINKCAEPPPKDRLQTLAKRSIRNDCARPIKGIAIFAGNPSREFPSP